MKYMLMFWDSDTTEYSVDEVMQMTVLKSWIDEMRRRGIRLHGSSLSPVGEGRLVRVRDGERLVHDGPFAETKDQIGGYDVIECASLDEPSRSPPRTPWRRPPRSRSARSTIFPGPSDAPPRGARVTRPPRKSSRSS